MSTPTPSSKGEHSSGADVRPSSGIDHHLFLLSSTLGVSVFVVDSGVRDEEVRGAFHRVARLHVLLVLVPLLEEVGGVDVPERVAPGARGCERGDGSRSRRAHVVRALLRGYPRHRFEDGPQRSLSRLLEKVAHLLLALEGCAAVLEGSGDADAALLRPRRKLLRERRKKTRAFRREQLSPQRNARHIHEHVCDVVVFLVSRANHEVHEPREVQALEPSIALLQQSLGALLRTRQVGKHAHAPPALSIPDRLHGSRHRTLLYQPALNSFPL
mmetsp:Transcript_28448/g.92924  ORF Transcript_28448/g.92924 Transcript_28448/m.92924 type:complete len:271 (+) Transcript_28448:1044-1856(+)